MFSSAHASRKAPRPPLVHAVSVPYGGRQLIGDRWQLDGQVGEALLLHGGGKSTGEGFEELRQTLSQHGIGSVAFDFIGHGRTGGALQESSLADRVAQTLAVIDALKLDLASLSLLGFSMGAYVAAQVARRAAIRRLGLAIPAAYAPEALEQPFGPAFSAVIRRERSWQDSDAFDLISRFSGVLLVLSAENDQVVPAEIPARYFEAARSASQKAHHVVIGAAHDLSQHYALYPESRARAYSQIVGLCLASAGRPAGRKARSTRPAELSAS